MLLTGHAASATVIARLVPNPFLAFLLGIISHIILDIIPHGDTELFPGSHDMGKKMSPENAQKSRKMFLSVGLLDTSMVLFLFSGLFLQLPLDFSVYTYALLGVLLFDIVDHFFTLFAPNIDKSNWILSRWHLGIHIIHKKLGFKDPFWRGTILQIALIGVTLFLNVYVWSSS